jgi:hypothetical protein
MCKLKLLGYVSKEIAKIITVLEKPIPEKIRNHIFSSKRPLFRYASLQLLDLPCPFLKLNYRVYIIYFINS